MSAPYLQQLLADSDGYQAKIERLLERFRVQPVGIGYIDLIVSRERAVRLIEELSRLPIAVTAMTLWCLATPESIRKQGCPHGMGGPRNEFGDGFFSEITWYFLKVEELEVAVPELVVAPHFLAENCCRVLTDYIENRLPEEPFFSECLHPGLWLHVPDEWERQTYLIE